MNRPVAFPIGGNTMRLPRPYIPLRVRVQAAFRTVADRRLGPENRGILPTWPLKRQLGSLLWLLGRGPYELDHVPALAQRKFNPRTGKYTPDANDPAFLVYRLKDDHRTKTYIRGDGAQRSDVAQQRYLKRIAARKKPRTKFKPRKTKHIRRSHAIQGHGDKA